MNYQKSLSYDDVALVPRYFAGTSRSSLDTSVKIGDINFNLPIIPANMKCVIDTEIAKLIQSNNYFYVMHRFGGSNYDFVLQANEDKTWNTISISVGVKEEDYTDLTKIFNERLKVHFITVDVAHGHCVAMKDMLRFITKHFPDTTVIAGNVGTAEGASNLADWGANLVKVGIGPGKSCITRLKTGFYTPMFSTIQHVKDKLSSRPHVRIIADGGIQHNGDIAKALVAGADLVMAGSVFAACVDSPGQLVGGKKHFYGSASAANKGISKNVEGKALFLPCNDLTYLEKFQEIKEDLQSSISYAGGSSLSDLKHAKYVLV